MPPIRVQDKVIAHAALTEMFQGFTDAEGDQYEPGIAPLIAQELIDRASQIRFQPSTMQVVLKFDLAVGDTD